MKPVACRLPRRPCTPSDPVIFPPQQLGPLPRPPASAFTHRQRFPFPLPSLPSRSISLSLVRRVAVSVDASTRASTHTQVEARAIASRRRIVQWITAAVDHPFPVAINPIAMFSQRGFCKRAEIRCIVSKRADLGLKVVRAR